MKLLQARIGDLRIGEIEGLQLGQPLQMSDARVGYFGAQSEVEIFEISQAFEIFHAGVGDFGIVKHQPFQVG